MNISKKHKKIKQNGYRWKRRKCITWYNEYGMFITRDKVRNTIDYEGEYVYKYNREVSKDG